MTHKRRTEYSEGKKPVWIQIKLNLNLCFPPTPGNIRNTEKLSYDRQQQYEIQVTAWDCGQKRALHSVPVRIDVKPVCKPGWQGGPSSHLCVCKDSTQVWLCTQMQVSGERAICVYPHRNIVWLFAHNYSSCVCYLWMCYLWMCWTCCSCILFVSYCLGFSSFPTYLPFVLVFFLVFLSFPFLTLFLCLSFSLYISEELTCQV